MTPPPGRRLRRRTHRLHLLDQDCEAASFVKKCPDCFVAILADGYAPLGLASSWLGRTFKGWPSWSGGRQRR